MAKQNRNYILSVRPDATSSTVIEIRPPFTLDLDIKRNTFGSASSATFRVNNLSEKVRSQIRKNNMEVNKVMYIKLEAGYGKNLATVFNGNISEAYSVREGTNMVTQMGPCFDGGEFFNKGFTNQQFPAGTTNNAIAKNFIDAMSVFGIKPGAIRDIPGSIPRGNSYTGKSASLLSELTGGAFFIDNGKANILGTDECIKADVRVISAQTGLLATPLRQGQFIYFDMLFEPQIQIGNRIKLISQTEKNVNGFYKVCSVSHKGIISDSVGGTVITNVGLYSPKALVEIEPETY